MANVLNISNLFPIIVSSTVIATIITAIFNFFSRRQDSYHKYITKDRGRWRESIRVIAEELPITEKENRNQLLNQLMTRLNPYGRLQGKEAIMLDGHIWNLISDIQSVEENHNENEKEHFSEEEIEQRKEHYTNVLQGCLLLLLKYDWERSKAETKGRFPKTATIIFMIIEGVLVTSLHFLTRSTINEWYIMGIVAFVFMPLFYPMLCFVIIDEEKLAKWKRRLIKCVILGPTVVMVIGFIGHYFGLTIQTFLDEQSYGWIFMLIILMIPISEFGKMAFSTNNEKKYCERVKSYLTEMEKEKHL